MSAHAHAFVESPLQMLCAIEAHAAGLGGDTTLLHARRDVPALRDARPELARLGLPSGLEITARPGGVSRTRGATWIVGDAFSGNFQARLATTAGLGRVVLVDDGLATLALVRVLTSADAPTQRIGISHRRLRTALGGSTTRRLLALAAGRRLTLFTAMPLETDDRAALTAAGVDFVPNELAWLTTRPPAAPVPEPTVILGSGLVADRLVDPRAYLSWVARVAADGPARYLPHRRNDPAVTSRVAALGVTVEAPGAPAEIRLRSLGAGQRVLMLPSTALVLLGSSLAGTGAEIVGVPVPDRWWTARASAPLRAHLSSVLDLVASPDISDAR